MMLKSRLPEELWKLGVDLPKIFSIKHKLQAWKKETNRIRSFGHFFFWRSETVAFRVNSALIEWYFYEHHEHNKLCKWD